MKEDTKFKALKEILYGAGISFIVGMIGYVLVFFFKLFSARVLGSEAFGIYEMTYTFISLLAMLSALGLTSALLRYVPYYKQRKEYSLLKGLKTYALVLKLIFSVFLGIILYFSAPFITTFLNFDIIFIQTLRVISFVLPFIVLGDYYISLLLSNKFIFLAKIGGNILFPSFLLIGILFISILDYTLLFLIYILGGSYVLKFLFSFISYNLTNKKVNVKKIIIKKEWLFFSLPLLFTGMLGFVLRWGDNFLIGYYLSAADVGIYAISFSMAYYVVFFASLLKSVITPILSEIYAKNYDEMMDIFNRIKTWSFIASSYFALVLIVFSSQILYVLFGKEFVQGSLSLSIMAAFFLGSVYFYFYNILLMINNDTKKIFYNTAIFMSLNIVLNIILIPILGILGAAIASGISYFFLRLGLMFFSMKYITLKSSLKGSRALLIILINLGFLFLLKYLITFLCLGIISLIIVLALAYTIFFVLTLFIFKVFTKEDIKLMLLIEKRLGIDLGFIKKFLRKLLK